MSEDLLKILGIIGLVVFLLYLFSNSLKLHLNMSKTIMEGLENNKLTGIAGSAEKYSNAIAEKSTFLRDSLRIENYRSQYENAIINLDEHAGLSMLQTFLQISPDKDLTSPENMQTVEKLNKLHAYKQSLNASMLALDKL
jgi:hypothetical protein